jgi:hypothetical protein
MKLTVRVNTCFFEVDKQADGELQFKTSTAIFPNGTNPIMISANTVAITHNITGTQQVIGGALTSIATVTSTFTPSVSATTVAGIYPSGLANLTASKTYQCSLSIVKNIWSQQANYGDGSQEHKLSNCRLYVPAYILQTDYEKQYLALGQRTIKYIDTFYKLFENFSTGEVQLQITSACVAPKRLLILPMIAKSSNTDGTNYYKPITSPFATEPATCSPHAITNLQVFLSGTPIYSSFQNYSYEQFLNEMNNFGLNGNLSTGLVSSRISLRHYLNNYGYIVCDLSRRLPEDENTSVSIDVSFKIISALALDFYVFVEQEKSMSINIVNGSRIA